MARGAVSTFISWSMLFRVRFCSLKTILDVSALPYSILISSHIYLYLFIIYLCLLIIHVYLLTIYLHLLIIVSSQYLLVSSNYLLVSSNYFLYLLIIYLYLLIIYLYFLIYLYLLIIYWYLLIIYLYLLIIDLYLLIIYLYLLTITSTNSTSKFMATPFNAWLYRIRCMCSEVFKSSHGLNPAYLSNIFRQSSLKYDLIDSCHIEQPTFRTFAYDLRSFRY